MPQLLLVVAAAILFFWILGRYGRGNPAATARLVRQGAGVGLIGFSAYLASRGGVVAAVPLLLFGLGLLIPNFSFSPGNFNWGRRTEGQKSSVRTQMLAMELDHDTGAMDGEVLAGEHKGRRLKNMALEELLRLLQECRSAPDQSASLLEAYLDRTHEGWRAASGGGRTAGAPPHKGAMSREQAYAVLGLKSGSGEREIRDAHRRLMKQCHPDRGGSDYLAAQINQAKDVLLGGVRSRP